ncbi:MAG: TRAP transporter TatT component family protein [Candidatus Thiodiazotropha sp. (ex Notomyrtea botanica)]|nr:TRAP transporter TatT component family protein [Candidatus Thiodiazotropha sp. (ex Notomyrtea botanica)]
MPQKRLLTLLLAFHITGCVSMATDRLAGNLTTAMLNQTDPEIVRSGAPAYLLLLDSLIEGDPEEQGLLFAGAKLYGAYAGGLVTDPERKKGLTTKALDYAGRGLCPETPELCQSLHQPYETFSHILRETDEDEIEGIYLYATSWAGWIQAHSDDWNAIADLPKAKEMLYWLVEQDPAYDNGRAQLYLGVIDSQVPPSLGGKPEIGRSHFESAIAYSNGRDLMAKVEYARHYARLVFNQSLHDRLLNEVVQADPVSPGLTLSNTMAQQQATQLLQDDYF